MRDVITGGGTGGHLFPGIALATALQQRVADCEVMFIGTANIPDPIPPPLRDRMEILELPGYTRREKLAIARRHLIPKQLDEHGLTTDQIEFKDEKPVLHAYHLLSQGKMENQGSAHDKFEDFVQDTLKRFLLSWFTRKEGTERDKERKFELYIIGHGLKD